MLRRKPYINYPKAMRTHIYAPTKRTHKVLLYKEVSTISTSMPNDLVRQFDEIVIKSGGTRASVLRDILTKHLLALQVKDEGH